MFVLLAEKDICEFTRVVRNQSHKLLLFKENRTGNFKLNCLKKLCQSCFCHFNKGKRGNRLQI